MSTFSNTTQPSPFNMPTPFTKIRWGDIDGNILNQIDLTDWLSQKADDRLALRQGVLFNIDHKMDIFPDYNLLGPVSIVPSDVNDTSAVGYEIGDLMTAGERVENASAISRSGGRLFGAARRILKDIKRNDGIRVEDIKDDNNIYTHPTPPTDVPPPPEPLPDSIPTRNAVLRQVHRLDDTLALKHQQIQDIGDRSSDLERRADENDIINAQQNLFLNKLDRQVGVNTEDQNDPSTGTGISLQDQANALYNRATRLETQMGPVMPDSPAYPAQSQNVQTQLDNLATPNLTSVGVQPDGGRVSVLERWTGTVDYITNPISSMPGDLQSQLNQNYTYFQNNKIATQARKTTTILDRTPNNITIVPTSTLDLSSSDFTSMMNITDRFLVNDANGTLAVYDSLIDSTQLNFRTISASPYGGGIHNLIGVVETFNYPALEDPPQDPLPDSLTALGMTVADITTNFHPTTTPSIDDYIIVQNDETKAGAVVKYFITVIDGSGNVTYGFTEIIATNPANTQNAITSDMFGRILIGGSQTGTFGPSMGPANVVVEGETTNIPNSDAIYQFVTGRTDPLDDRLQIVEEKTVDTNTFQTAIPGGGNLLLTQGGQRGTWGPTFGIDVSGVTPRATYIPTSNAVLSLSDTRQGAVNPTTQLPGYLLTAGIQTGTWGDSREIVSTIGTASDYTSENGTGIPTEAAIVGLVGDGLFQTKTEGQILTSGNQDGWDYWNGIHLLTLWVNDGSNAIANWMQDGMYQYANDYALYMDDQFTSNLQDEDGVLFEVTFGDVIQRTRTDTSTGDWYFTLLGSNASLIGTAQTETGDYNKLLTGGQIAGQWGAPRQIDNTIDSTTAAGTGVPSTLAVYNSLSALPKAVRLATAVVGLQGIHNLNTVDYLAIQNQADLVITHAIEVVRTTGGGSVYVREGYYVQQNSIAMYEGSNVKLYGSGTGTQLTVNGNITSLINVWPSSASSSPCEICSLSLMKNSHPSVSHINISQTQSGGLIYIHDCYCIMDVVTGYIITLNGSTNFAGNRLRVYNVYVNAGNQSSVPYGTLTTFGSSGLAVFGMVGTN